MPPFNTIFCCSIGAFVEGGGFALARNDGVPLKVKAYPEWEKCTSLRSAFEQALLGERMREILLEASKDVSDLAPHLNKLWVPDINEKLLISRGFRCEAKFSVTYSVSGNNQRNQPNEHFALAIFKMNSADDTDGTPFSTDQGPAEGGRIARPLSDE